MFRCFVLYIYIYIYIWCWDFNFYGAGLFKTKGYGRNKIGRWHPTGTDQSPIWSSLGLFGSAPARPGLARPGPARGGQATAQPAAGPGSVYQAGPQGLLREPGRPTIYFKWAFYVDESVPFEETSHFACTGALVPGTATTSIFQPGRIDKHFTCTRSVFVWPPGSR